MNRRGIYYADLFLQVLEREIVVLRPQLVLLVAIIGHVVWPDILLPDD